MPESSRPGARLAHIGIAVRTVDSSISFYRDVLGMPEVPLEDADGAHIAGLAAGESLVELLESERVDSPIGKFVAARGHSPHRRGAAAGGRGEANRLPASRIDLGRARRAHRGLMPFICARRRTAGAAECRTTSRTSGPAAHVPPENSSTD